MRIAKILVMAVVVGFTSSLFAAEGQSAGGNIAVVDFGKAIFGTEVAKARMKQKKGESEFATLQGKYESTVSEMKALKKEIDTQGMTWSQEQVADAQKKMEYLRADLELITRKIQGDQQALQNSIVQELRPKAGEALQELIEEEGIVLLLSSEAVVTAAPSLDVTAKLTDRLNKKTQ
ncbi:OmpH/Skp family outer membrane protein [Porticoccus litoralis]|uniref:OmpH family outer membrane protein n=1 Tax=Porticoccus litoralis TaxID=434086 RepID=A0AAW8AYE9_9GAMM|nr:OmpH family outer membrane protein [Porticoccus litoralis]MDP1519494.1 OmpH family outer membrane protein [Porticoccus litoralis]TNE87339.1 MAG: OmpH family outer membrane protein [Gammaproteobacteria bacterium]